MRRIIGDPQSFFSSARSTITRMDLADKIVSEHARIAQQALESGVTDFGDRDLAGEAMTNVFAQQGQGQQGQGQQGQGQQGKAVLDEGFYDRAREAIAQGKDENAVRQRILDLGGDPARLNIQ